MNGGTGYDRAEAQGTTGVTMADAGGQGFEMVVGTSAGDTFTTSTAPDGAEPHCDLWARRQRHHHRLKWLGHALGDAGADTLRGNGGDDRIYFDVDDLVILGGPGFDEALAQGADPVTFDVGGNGFERAEGTSGNDIFTSSTIPDSAPGVTILGKVRCRRYYGFVWPRYISAATASLTLTMRMALALMAWQMCYAAKGATTSSASTPLILPSSEVQDTIAQWRRAQSVSPWMLAARI